MADKKRATLTDVAKRAGVGIATVDRVLNGRAPVSKETAARVLVAAETLGYHARGLMRQRIQEMVPRKRLGFVLQKQSKWFYQELADAVREAASRQRAIRAEVDIAFVESLSPDVLSREILRLANRCDAVAVVSIDHPEVTAAIAVAATDGVPVFALLSPLNAPDISGFCGVDGRKAGRTAGWAMARLSGGVGDVGILVGSHRYLGHEALEAGFHSAMREYAPEKKLRESIVFLDDKAVAYEAAAELLASSPSLSGLYQVGGGVSGVIKALEESGRAGEMAYICHENSPTTKRALTTGLVDAVIATPIAEIAEAAVNAMARKLCGTRPIERSFSPEFRLITPENA